MYATLATEYRLPFTMSFDSVYVAEVKTNGQRVRYTAFLPTTEREPKTLGICGLHNASAVSAQLKILRFDPGGEPVDDDVWTK